MRASKLLVFLAFAMFLAGCEKETVNERPTEVAGEEIPGEKEVREAAEGAGPEDCVTFFKEVREACLAQYNKGLKARCQTQVTKARVTLTQLDGKLFQDPNGTHSDKELGHKICAVSIKSLRKKLAKAESIPVSLSADCKALVRELDTSCFMPLTRGEKPASGCTSVLGLTKKMDEKGQAMCKPMLGTIQ